MKTFRRTLLVALSVAAFAASFQAAAQDFKPRIIRFGYGLNEASNQGRATKLFAEEVEKASGGKMRVRAIGAAALGSDLQMQQALIGGAQEMMVGSTATLVGITKEMAIWDTPFLFNNAKEASLSRSCPRSLFEDTSGGQLLASHSASHVSPRLFLLGAALGRGNTARVDLACQAQQMLRNLPA